MRRREVLSLAALAASPTLAATAIAPDDGVAPAGVVPSGNWVHAYAAFGEPKYPRGFDHFEYLNPNAPKGGTLYLPPSDRRTSIDKLNYYTIKGNAPAGVALFMIESLAYLGADETQTMYGLLAQEMLVAPDKSAIVFRLHPKARFSNGDPVTSVDVKYSFDILTSPLVLPNYSTDLAGVAKAIVVDARTIRFDLRDASSDQLFKIGRMPVFSRKWGLKADGTRPPFDQIINDDADRQRAVHDRAR